MLTTCKQESTTRKYCPNGMVLVTLINVFFSQFQPSGTAISSVRGGKQREQHPSDPGSQVAAVRPRHSLCPDRVGHLWYGGITLRVQSRQSQQMSDQARHIVGSVSGSQGVHIDQCGGGELRASLSASPHGREDVARVEVSVGGYHWTRCGLQPGPDTVDQLPHTVRAGS